VLLGMDGNNKTIIQTLKKIGEEIETVSLSDRNAWKGIFNQLEKVNRDFPEEISELSKLLTLCLEGVKAISEKSATGSLVLVEAISEGLIALEQYLLDDPDRELLIRKAAQALGSAMGRDICEWGWNNGSKPVRWEKPSNLSLNDVAALLIQLEPDDLSGLACLGESLNTIAADESYPESSRESIVQAAKKIEGIIEGSVFDSDSTMKEVGRLIEEAMNAMEEGVKVERRPTPDSIPEDEEGSDEEGVRSDYLPDDADPDLLSEFITESSDLITNAEEALLSLETDPEDMEAVGTVLRAFHTIKGTSAFLELTLISEMAHHAESLLIRVRDREIRYTDGYAGLGLRALDMLKELIQSLHDALEGKHFLKPEGYDDLMRILADPEGAGISDEYVEPEEPSLRTHQHMKGTRQVVESSVRVRTDRLDRLIDMVGELVVAHSMVAQDRIVIHGNHHELLKKVAHTGKIVRELQDLSMSMRMIPLKATFQKMARLVRDVAHKAGKKVNFITEGEDTEIDRNMVDVINDPLVHMVRNAVDHGIELPEIRQKIGKPEYGIVQLSAYHSAGNVVVEIKDDGRGLDREAILAKARERGLVSGETSLSDREIFDLVFEPGFSTAKTVTEISGRGVGMDVVKKNIEALHGQVEIQSEVGKGSVFRMRLPLTLAIIDGMVVRVGGERYVIPTVSIIRSIKPDPKDLSTVLNQGEMLSLQGELIPLFRLADLFDIKGAQDDPNQGLVVVIEDNGRKAGLLVDELVGRQQIVIKTLGEAMRDIPGISGGAIMPDGRVGLILDVDGLVRLANTGDGEGINES